MPKDFSKHNPKKVHVQDWKLYNLYDSYEFQLGFTQLFYTAHALINLRYEPPSDCFHLTFFCNLPT